MPRADATDRSAEDATPSGRPAPSAQGSVEQVVARAALDLVNDLTGTVAAAPPGSLNFSPSSLDRLDDVLQELHEAWAASDTTGVALPADLRNAFGSYLGEVARKEFGGRYVAGDKHNPFWLVVGQAGTAVRIGVCGAVTARVVEGPVRSLPAFHERVRQAVAAGGDATLV